MTVGSGVLLAVPNGTINNVQQAQGTGGTDLAHGCTGWSAGVAVPLASTPTPPPTVEPKLPSAIAELGQRVTALDSAVQELISQQDVQGEAIGVNSFRIPNFSPATSNILSNKEVDSLRTRIWMI